MSTAHAQLLDIREFPVFSDLEIDKAFTRQLNSYRSTKSGTWVGGGRVDKEFVAYKNPFYVGMVIVAYKNKVIGYYAYTGAPYVYRAHDAAAYLVDGSFRGRDICFCENRKKEAIKESGIDCYNQLLSDEFGPSID